MENPEVRRKADAGVQGMSMAGLWNDGYVVMNFNRWTGRLTTLNRVMNFTSSMSAP